MSLRRTERASADVATGRGVLSMPRAMALWGLNDAFLPAGVFGDRGCSVEKLINGTLSVKDHNYLINNKRTEIQ
ncbi:hypothetical protein M3210_01350 [Oceanobacillus luteolus]|uniref:Uncharacterized protein n=1 Tax=Oceanobacillus luteolus TaxID=1274358 RepID=A0ABW4HUC4_9BACI|nr:hypothetical protein [Oceanobacillus luteolus]MCM3738902.1 hypothetical protein [Oceanobacillus luteolus]